MSKKVLIVDDSLTVRLYHRQILEKANYICDEAENGMEALEKAQLSNYDIYLVDVNMPVLDGYSFVKRLREGEGSIAPVIMVSTESEEMDMDLAYESGASVYLVKPARPDDLILNINMLTFKK
ncbi:two-component system response regulator [Malaciobacter canalis]|uniref:Two-component system response regulator n=1 Tax=Malaciobacter canalis TaxID=1912871 RepID=A0ABX4LS20_9BACT|nr:response regulator [Malaciobacter canalis]PHO08961.1 two-component system response regulator [Malaciobacter canalis]QEE32733.1 response regulator receiver domain-containing protein [Malaciobacter canalis]